jgi:guanylate kinase
MILLVGASASGKTEVAKDLYRLFGIKKAVTHTSRLPRPGEKDGVDYHFVDKETFLKLDSEGKMVENTFYNGNHYGC